MKGARVTRDYSGRYTVMQRCDACSRPIHGDHYTDDAVCAGSDDPGFYLCGRKRCIRHRSDLPDKELRQLYADGRTRNDLLRRSERAKADTDLRKK